MNKTKKYYVSFFIMTSVLLPVLFHMNQNILMSKSQILSTVADSIPAKEWDTRRIRAAYIRSRYYNVTYSYSSQKYTVPQMNELMGKRLANEGWKIKYNIDIPHGETYHEHYVFMGDNDIYDIRVELRREQFTVIVSFR